MIDISTASTVPEGTAPETSVRKRHIGVSDLSVFPIAMSGNVFGWTADEAATDDILDTYVAHGGNFIDTADAYAAGRSETMIGNWMRRRRNRADLVIATKVGKSADNPGLSPRAITRAVDASLGRLGTSHIDLLYLHVDDLTVPFEETLLGVDGLIRSGKVRWFGGSDHTGNRIIEARIACAQLGVAPMVALQKHYNLLHRTEYERDLAQVAATQSLGVMPRFALASGFLAGKYRTKADLVRQRARRRGEPRYLGRRGLRVLSALDGVAADLDASVASVSLAWLLTRANVVAPVVSASRADQVPRPDRPRHPCDSPDTTWPISSARPPERPRRRRLGAAGRAQTSQPNSTSSSTVLRMSANERRRSTPGPVPRTMTAMISTISSSADQNHGATITSCGTNCETSSSRAEEDLEHADDRAGHTSAEAGDAVEDRQCRDDDDEDQEK